MKDRDYDVIVIGGGHAGTEAALAAARLGARTLLVTQHLDNLGQLSCNPAIGGIGKAHLVKEIDALGGAMARAADRAAIHCRVLNASKGPAVQSTRMQTDRELYKRAIRDIVEQQPYLNVFQAPVDDLLLEGEQVVGVVTPVHTFRAGAVVLTTGTFLAGRIHMGAQEYAGGRAGEPASQRLALRLREMPLKVGRLRTGTPPRLDGRSLDLTHLVRQGSDNPRPVFASVHTPANHPEQVPCYITYTNPTTHSIVEEAFCESPLFSKELLNIHGPRYCPSIEMKILRFKDKSKHQIFVEPEGLRTHEVYPNGISTSLPYAAQLAFIRSIQGFEKAHMTRPGYAIEYDFFDPRGLSPTLAVQNLQGLYFAGQINGTTGYEEAAAQGLIAGLNAALQVMGRDPWYPKRHEAYIGVLLDDLTTQGASEPYRMFTARAEHRLFLREDNAAVRLTPIGRTLGLIDDEHWQHFQSRLCSQETERSRLEKTWVRQGSDAARAIEQVLGEEVQKDYRLIEWLQRPEFSYQTLMGFPGLAPEEPLPFGVGEALAIELKYKGYIVRQKASMAHQERYHDKPLSTQLNYYLVAGMSAEAQEKLSAVKPVTLGQASRIPGVTPAAISALLVYLKKHSSVA